MVSRTIPAAAPPVEESRARLSQSLSRVLARAFAPVDIAPLVFFRVFFGAVMLWDVWRYFTYNRIVRYFMLPDYHFPYFNLHWVNPLPGDGMIWLFYGMGVLAVCIILGIGYRIAAALFFVAFTYTFLLDQSLYLNHFYLIVLVSFLMIFLPANRALSVDAFTWRGLKSQTAPAWTLWLLRAQVGLVYFFGGIAKLNGDWLRGEPLRAWLGSRTDFPLIGHLFTEDWMVYVFSYGGLLLDLFIVPFLLWRRTRWIALAFMLAFHLTNYRLFSIGVFPWFMIGATLLFLDPQTIRRVIPVGLFNDVPPASAPRRLQTRHYVILALLGVYLGWQFLFPLRHFVYAGDVNWTEEGHKFAWHMKLRSKRGDVRFFATDPVSRTTWEMDPLHHLNSSQYSKMVGRPDMILSFAHHLAADIAAQGFPDVEIRVWSLASLNGRERQLFIDPTVDLAQQHHTLLADSWILPLEQPLKGANHLLMIANRGDDNLLFINMTRRPFPIQALTFDFGTHTLNGGEWADSRLGAGECLRALPGADTPALDVICTEAREPLVLDAAYWHGGFDVYYQDEIIARCDDETCIVSIPAE